MSRDAHRFVVGAVAVLAIGVLTSPALADRDEGCRSCHATRAEARLRAPVHQENDAHGRAGLGCTRCHGGDGSATDARAHDLAGGFRGVPDAIGVSQVCGRCHDGSRDDAPDVLAAFRAGAHGAAIAHRRDGAASCTDCHGAHTIEGPDHARSPVARAQVVGTCTRCHADEERMAFAGLDPRIPQRYAQSVHGRALAEGSEDAPTCAGCHGAHQNGGGLEAAQACAQCHEAIREAFDRGPHASAFSRLGFLDCAECHGSHEVRPADASLLAGLGAACERCHGEGQEVYARVVRLTESAERVDGAREAWERDDPRRIAVISAIHALDVDALAEALEGAPMPADASDGASRGAPREPPGPRRDDDAEPGPRATARPLLPLAGALFVGTAIVVALVRLSRRRGGS